MNRKEASSFPWIGKLNSELNLSDHEDISRTEKMLLFAMFCNGYRPQTKTGGWIFDNNIVSGLSQEFKGQQISFYGPSNHMPFFQINNCPPDIYAHIFNQEPVTGLIGKLIDEGAVEQAGRTAFLLGGVVRQSQPQISSSPEKTENIIKAVKFAAEMTSLGDKKSADALTSCSAMYLNSNQGALKDEEKLKLLKRYGYYMSDAIRRDPVLPVNTLDLGLSQVARLRTFLNNIYQQNSPDLPNITPERKIFNEFPTVGAEFHFSPDTTEKYENFWERVALLNMSQYQGESSIQLSRNDRDVIEIRMNPSVYPVTTANWQRMLGILPELNTAFFTVTLNRKDTSFRWINLEDKKILDKLRGLGMLSYAGMFDKLLQLGKREEIDFGGVYLGQTVTLNEGSYCFEGDWNGGEGSYGQFGLYVGYGNTLPGLAYYLSMALAEPDILNLNLDLANIRTIQDALALPEKQIRYIFTALKSRIEMHPKLGQAKRAGEKMYSALTS